MVHARTAVVCCALACLMAVASAAPVTVAPTPDFNSNATGVFSVTEKNPNPDVTVEWEIKYDPPQFAVVAVEAAMLPGSDDKFLFVGRFDGVKHNYTEYMATTVDLNTGEMANITSPSNLFCGHLCPTSDGKILVVGGSRATPNGFTSGLDFLGVYDYENSPEALSREATMAVGRWYPSAILLPDSTIMIQGGTQTTSEFGPNSKIIERWDPKNPTLTPPKAYMKDADYIAKMGKDFFPLLYVLPTGDVFTQQDQLVRFWNPRTGTYRTVDGVPAFPDTVKNQWPRSGSMIMGPMTHEDNYSSVEVTIMGGVPTGTNCSYGPPGNQVVASRKVYTLKITWTIDADGVPTYEFPAGDWEEEDMGIPRTGGDGTLTAAGDIILTSGSQRGCHGGSSQGLSRNSYPALWPILYQTDKPKGQRVTVMEATGIARVYHMVAALTRDGHVMVAGCDSCQPSANFKTGIDRATDGWWSPSITGRRDHRTEVLKHPFSLDEANRPSIVAVAGNQDDAAIVTTTYGSNLVVEWAPFVDGNEVEVTGASLAAPSAATHSYNANQRLLKLEIVARGPGTVTLKMPPNANVAPPQHYMLFLLNGKTNSRSRWIKLEAAAGRR